MNRSPRSFTSGHSEEPSSPPSQSEASSRSSARVFNPDHVIIEDDPFDAIDENLTVPEPVNIKKKSRWVSLFLVSFSAILSMAFTLWLDRLVREFFNLSPWLGYLALFFVFLILIAFCAVIGKEIWGLIWERKIEKLRKDATDSIAVNDSQKAQNVLERLAKLYASPRMDETHIRIRNLHDEIIDASDRLAIGEREYLLPLDQKAKLLVASTAKQVSLVTAISPRALIDIAFVLYAMSRLLRQIAGLYGGRPGFIGSLRLFRLALAHLVLTTGIAMGDSVAQDLLGAGLAARLSSRFGEGILNGSMTARFGIAAIAICRPLPFIQSPAPRFSDVVKDLTSKMPSDEK